MSVSLLYAFAGVALCAMGGLGFTVLEHLLRKLLAFNLMGSGVFLVLVGLAQHRGVPDPVPQAMVLTGIVVTIAATALAVVLMRRYYHLSGQTGLVVCEERKEPME
ncbi:NADH-quinone oxidoreductase subunit K [Marinobacter daepoensis]|uniref:NADH-quinone oxidoreductase subunit K n=1 Tax=Marinobacter daepoensis TaxID=262077 RepID=A0ABS3BG84_9GAMM|nr:NADH-quinone oxidoreductase subunit K [Marinobacter daepoensis]MBN7770844.1 NADH-quinone oxidoreductase subunit K [Marinobacter daepoensis]MBY6033192.1 NADH-quinone oxidoreductase subunit K [Marinobacter daepoensis]MBY6078705.1 NADH-quinone oxidoreductase subunit K [Marinobacter daepoensis]